MRILITAIKSLVGIENDHRKARVRGVDMGTIDSLEDAWLLIEAGMVHSFGSMSSLPEVRADETIDASGRLVLPAFCDSHTHIVFAAPREGEFVDRIKGLSYEEIARRGGGILNKIGRAHV